MSVFSQVAGYLRFASGLRGFLREPITLDHARQIIRKRLESREDNLLAAARANIYALPDSPYLKLLRLAGCEYGDFERLVRSEGVDGALRQLYGKGVYVTLGEFKGTQDISRGSTSFPVTAADFNAPVQPGALELRSGATRSAGTRTSYDFKYLSNYTIHRLVELSAGGAFDVPYGIWMPILPGGGPRTLLTAVKAGLIPVKWFSQVGGKGSGSRLEDRLSTNFMVFAGRAFGARLPRPEYVHLDRAELVAQWMSAMIKQSGGCFLNTYPSSAVRACQAARNLGLDLTGAGFTGAGEPFTEAKRSEIESAGGRYIPSYASVETGIIGPGCTRPQSTGEVHLFSDALALIQHTRNVPHSGVTVEAFLLTTLLGSAPKVMLNTETGDYGLVGNRPCGCDHEAFGLTTHISDIRGFDKLTAEGMTLIGTDLVRIVEEVLPARFGGSSTDYQILEEEEDNGHTRMSVLVSPEVGDIDEDELVRTLLAGLPHGITPNVWSYAGTFRVKRVKPMATARGKLMPLHILKRGEKGGA